jgi:HEAT repeat protein
MDLGTASVDELFTLARASEDADAYWACVSQLHARGGERVFKLAEVLCDSIVPGERCLGADVLGQLEGFDSESRPVLRALLEDDDQPAVLAAAAAGAGFLCDEEAKPRLEALVEHSEVGVRFAALHALVRLEDGAEAG